jgi:hypothetical protein
MSEIGNLAERHILESEARLRHIDELMERARQVRTAAAPAGELEGLLMQTQHDRDRLAQHLDDMRRHPVEDLPRWVEQGQGLRGTLEAVGRQLEQTLAAIFK